MQAIPQNHGHHQFHIHQKENTRLHAPRRCMCSYKHVACLSALLAFRLCLPSHRKRAPSALAFAAAQESHEAVPLPMGNAPPRALAPPSRGRTPLSALDELIAVATAPPFFVAIHAQPTDAECACTLGAALSAELGLPVVSREKARESTREDAPTDEPAPLGAKEASAGGKELADALSSRDDARAGAVILGYDEVETSGLRGEVKHIALTPPATGHDSVELLSLQVAPYSQSVRRRERAPPTASLCGSLGVCTPRPSNCLVRTYSISALSSFADPLW
eukprot:2750274-Pleurochrysis_carterae.AAC.4